MKTLLELLLAFFRLGVEGEPNPNAEKPDAGAGGEPDPDVTPPDDDLDVDPDALPGDDKGRGDAPTVEQFAAAQAAVKTEQEARERAERERDDLRQRIAPRQYADPVIEEEDRRLRDPKITPTERWQIESNRVIRANEMRSNQALAQAQDVSDKTTFGMLAIKSPAVFKKYESLVDKRLTEMRARGFNAPRAEILKNLIGEDMLEGKFKKAAKKDDTTTTAPRGKLPGARSDVSGKNAQTEHQKRAARLENVQI